MNGSGRGGNTKHGGDLTCDHHLPLLRVRGPREAANTFPFLVPKHVPKQVQDRRILDQGDGADQVHVVELVGCDPRGRLQKGLDLCL